MHQSLSFIACRLNTAQHLYCLYCRTVHVATLVIQSNSYTINNLTLRLLMSYIYIYMEHLFLMFLDHIWRRSTVVMTPLDEWSARRRDLYLTTHDTHNRQISMPPVEFEPTILAGERPHPLNPELNPICHLLALLAHHFLHVSRIRVKSLTLRLLMSYIHGAPILDVSRSHTTTQHSR